MSKVCVGIIIGFAAALMCGASILILATLESNGSALPRDARSGITGIFAGMLAVVITPAMCFLEATKRKKDISFITPPELQLSEDAEANTKDNYGRWENVNLLATLKNLPKENGSFLAALKNLPKENGNLLTALKNLPKENGNLLTALKNLPKENGNLLTALKNLPKENGNLLTALKNLPKTGITAIKNMNDAMNINLFDISTSSRNDRPNLNLIAMVTSAVFSIILELMAMIIIANLPSIAKPKSPNSLPMETADKYDPATLPTGEY